MKPQRLIITNRENEKLVGYLYKNTSKTLMIMCHGADPINGYPGVEDVFAYYYSTGTSLYCFDFSGYGESEGKKELSVNKRVSDLESVIEYFSHKFERIILYGLSFGAICVAIAAAKNKRISRVITINGLFSLNPKNLFFQQNFTVGLFLAMHPKLMRELVYFTRHSPARKITVPTLVIYGENDRDVKPLQSVSFFSKLPAEKQLLVVPGGDHILMDKAKWKYLKPLQDWIKKDVAH